MGRCTPWFASYVPWFGSARAVVKTGNVRYLQQTLLIPCPDWPFRCTNGRRSEPGLSDPFWRRQATVHRGGAGCHGRHRQTAGHRYVKTVGCSGMHSSAPHSVRESTWLLVFLPGASFDILFVFEGWCLPHRVLLTFLFLLCLFSGHRSQQLTQLSVQFTYLSDPHYPRYLDTPCAYKTTFPLVDSKVEPSSHWVYLQYKKNPMTNISGTSL